MNNNIYCISITGKAISSSLADFSHIGPTSKLKYTLGSFGESNSKLEDIHITGLIMNNHCSNCNQFIVQDYEAEERSCVFLNYENLKKLLWGNYGDVLLLKGRRGKEFACIVLPDDTISKRGIGINRMIRDRLQVRVGDIVTI